MNYVNMCAPCYTPAKMLPPQLTTTSGLMLDMRYMRDFHEHPGSNDKWRGTSWTVDLVEAHYEGIPVGYLRASFICGDDYDQTGGDLISWLAWRQERADYADLKEVLVRGPQSEWSQQDIIDALQASYPRHHRSADRMDEIAAYDLDQAQAAWAERIAFLTEEFEDAYQRDRYFTRAKPQVEYVDVYDNDQVSRYCDGYLKDFKRLPDHWPDSMQRQGIATAMYQAMALLLQERGLVLYPDAPHMQEYAAKMVWAKMDKTIGLGEDRFVDSRGEEHIRLYLDGASIKIDKPVLDEKLPERPHAHEDTRREISSR